MSKIASILLLSLTFFACSNDESGINVDSEANPKSVVYQDNPLEYVGVEHNKFMAEFMPILERSYKNGKWSKVTFLSDNYTTQFSSVMNEAYHKRYESSTSTVEGQKEVYEKLDLNEWFDGDETTSLDLAKASLESKASDKDGRFTNNLLQDVYETSFKQYKSKKEAYAALEKVIQKHEELILAEDWKSNEKYALGTLAVAKHSTQFWKNYDFSEFRKNDYLSTYSDPDPESSIIVGADMAGWVIGGVTGATAGSFAGPAGSFGGFIGGKMAGSFTASTAAAGAISIYEAFVDFFGDEDE